MVSYTLYCTYTIPTLPRTYNCSDELHSNESENASESTFEEKVAEPEVVKVEEVVKPKVKLNPFARAFSRFLSPSAKATKTAAETVQENVVSEAVLPIASTVHVPAPTTGTVLHKLTSNVSSCKSLWITGI